jgi:hypothetical protein
MKKRFQVVVEIQDSQIIDVLSGSCNPFNEGVWSIEDGVGQPVIKCQGLEIAKAIVTSYSPFEWNLTHVACQNARHDPHPRYKELYERYHNLLGNKDVPACSYCDGSGWVEATSDFVDRVVMLASSIMMFKGIPLAKNGYKENLAAQQRANAAISGILEIGGAPGTSELINSLVSERLDEGEGEV